MQILDATDIDRRVARLSHQILERNYTCEHLWLAGINGQGAVLAQALFSQLLGLEVLPFELGLCLLDVNKRAESQPEVRVEGVDWAALERTTIVLVDDVLNSGRTLCYALSALMGRALGGVQIAVLVERAHRLYPVAATFSGYSLPTTMESHIEVVLEGDKRGVYLASSTFA
jgi:pyrimidine operon attenuation protein / uracil phosphoribosyltransferase